MVDSEERTRHGEGTNSGADVAFGLRLKGDASDLAALFTLSQSDASVLEAAWTEWRPAGVHTVRCVLSTAGLDRNRAGALALRGLDMVAITRSSRGAVFLAPLSVRDGVAQQPESWEQAETRLAEHLMEAVRPRVVPGDPRVDEALFVVPVEGVAASRTIERLLLLGREDVAVSEWNDGVHTRMYFRVEKPPLYLLMRARDEVQEQVAVYARSTGSSAWIAWGYAHPLESSCARWLSQLGRQALVNADGTWVFLPTDVAARNVFDVIRPRFEPRMRTLQQVSATSKFTIPLRLRYAGERTSEGDVWLLTQAELLSLEQFVQSATSDELGRFTLARLEFTSEGTTTHGTRDHGVVYLLRELSRPGLPRLGARVADLVGRPGYVRAAGIDNLYLPAGKQLFPRLRRDEVRTLLNLESAHSVVVDEDRDGPTVITISALDEVPLAQWVQYVATDRRVELDRLLESTVFELPEVRVAKPVREDKPDKTRERTHDKDERDTDEPTIRRRAKPVKKVEVQTDAPPTTQDEAQVRARIAELEVRVNEGGCDDTSHWHELGALKTRVNDLDDAAMCLEASAFHRAPRERAKSEQMRSLLHALVGVRAQIANITAAQSESAEFLLDMAMRGTRSGAETSWMGARALERMSSDEPVMEALVQEFVKIFSDPSQSVSRRLAWTVISSAHRRSEASGGRADALGMTRAKERLLGGVNDKGLSDVFDLPRFVRVSLALETGADSPRSRGDQHAALEDLWSLMRKQHVKEIDSMGAFVRVLFAVGMTRLGANALARELVEGVESEISVHDPPNRVLFKLYIAHAAHVATQGTAEAWQREVEAQLSTVKGVRARDPIEWLRRRSLWLRTNNTVEPRPNISEALKRALDLAEAEPERIPTVLADTMENMRLFDFEVFEAIDRGLKLVLRTGNDAMLSESLNVVMRRISSRIQILGHRASALGACLRGAATLGDSAAVDTLLDELVNVANAPDVPSLRDLLNAVQPGLAALRRLGAVSSAKRFFDALSPLAEQGKPESMQLRAALVDGYLQLRDEDRARALLDANLQDLLRDDVEHRNRYESAAAMFAALQHWPVDVRMKYARAVLGRLDLFRDTFTVRNFYETHKVLVIERVIDMIADDSTQRSDRVQSYLDAEEQAIRRTIIADWNEACGR